MRNLSSFVLCSLLVSTAATADVTDKQDYTFDLNEGGRISLSNVNGDIDIQGGDGDQVRMTVTRKAGTQEYLDGLKVEIDSSDDYLRIETRHPKTSGRWFNWSEDSSGSVSYRLTVPGNVELDTIDTVNGHISIAGVKGPVGAESVNGRLSLEGLESDAKLDTVNGTIKAQFNTLTGEQRVSADAVNGSVTLILPENTSARVHAETLNGGIDADDFGLSPDRGFVGRDLDGQIGDGAARVNLDTVNGSITLRKTH